MAPSPDSQVPLRPLRILVTGGTGFLGGAVLAAARRDPHIRAFATFHRTAPPPAEGLEWRALDLRDPAALAPLLDDTRPDVVLHTAVATAPGELESVIVQGSALVAAAARARGARMIHLSSDMVFDGASGPFSEGAPPFPITAYGRAKARAEAAVRTADPDAILVRASLLYRLEPPDRSLKSWLDDLAGGTAYALFTDELRCPAQVDDLAAALLELARRLGRGEEVPRILHGVGPQTISRHAFGQLVLRTLGRDPELAVAARLQDSGMVRPQALVLTTLETPAWFTHGLRGPTEALSAQAARVRRTSS